MMKERKSLMDPIRDVLKVHDRLFSETKDLLETIDRGFEKVHRRLDFLLDFDFDIQTFDEKSLEDFERKVKEYAEKHPDWDVRASGFVLMTKKPKGK
ncbi:MAG: hypothetical protein QMC85_06975 [Methanocellales archaeon]|nr:hypothetical protein [Methanocellales archaeon]